MKAHIILPEPRKDKSNISWIIFSFLREGSCENKYELIVKIHEFLEKENILSNTKGKEINVKTIENNVNEILRYLYNKREGWYSYYDIKDMKIIPIKYICSRCKNKYEYTKICKCISGVKQNGKNRICGRDSKVQNSNG